ncbi:hypothetical protein PYW07_002008 [Mythimna separata]|uniref:tRNA/rRNA methyltransferase SpoU type domain-containing protein n=1 Tax=Mythimna separata TaxID=271217 RepID=A0AAD7YMG5_MYTSE|nr:hypothetical protein PYW07_002008 [Mythimna separata]
MYNNIVISYCNKIIEYGPVKTNPLYYLIRRLNSKDVEDYGHLIYVLCEILLYCPVPRKDQRIVDNLTLEVLQNSAKYRINKESIDIHFNYEIQYLAIATLCNIKDTETLRMITNFITIRIDNTFKNKQRYHGNSALHRVLLTTLQHIVVLVLKNGDLKNVFTWCLDMLVKLPHQPSVRVCLEWFLSLYFYIQKTPLNEETLQILKAKNIPITSQFIILYWLLKHKISNNTYTENEYNFIMDYLLSHTMGQLFNNIMKDINESMNSNAQDDFVKEWKVYKKVDDTFELQTNKGVDSKIAEDSETLGTIQKKYIPWKNMSDVNVYDVGKKRESPSQLIVVASLIDKLPNLGGMARTSEVFGVQTYVVDSLRHLQDKQFQGLSEVFGVQTYVVDSLRHLQDKQFQGLSEVFGVQTYVVDSLRHLQDKQFQGLSEVFGVQTYVVDSLRHLQDKQFQGLSVSAEKWINVEEVRPGRPLKEYLLRKKEEGYAVVAAEQTSTSSKLQGFRFPKKTLLLLGHEKEGVPCDLLPLMDHCVEIPQQGYVRSLNVHVTAAIFVWEYARQNVL